MGSGALSAVRLGLRVSPSPPRRSAPVSVALYRSFFIFPTIISSLLSLHFRSCFYTYRYALHSLFFLSLRRPLAFLSSFSFPSLSMAIPLSPSPHALPSLCFLCLDVSSLFLSIPLSSSPSLPFSYRKCYPSYSMTCAVRVISTGRPLLPPSPPPVSVTGVLVTRRFYSFLNVVYFAA